MTQEIPTSIQSQAAAIAADRAHSSGLSVDSSSIGQEVGIPTTVDARVVTTPGDTQGLLTGPRREGLIPRPDGAVEVHEVTGDGMKQTRIARPRIKSPSTTAHHFHESKGLATPGTAESGIAPDKHVGFVGRVLKAAHILK